GRVLAELLELGLVTLPDLAAAAFHLVENEEEAATRDCSQLHDRRLTCAEYAERLTDRRRSLAELLPEPGALPDDHKATVTATWSLSIQLADRLVPVGLARPALELASLLDPEGIPEEVFTTAAAVRWLSDAAGREVD